MTQVGYLISVTTSIGNTTSWQSIHNIVGKIQPVIGSSTDQINRSLFITVGRKKSEDEIRTQLQEVPDFREIILVTWYDPVPPAALAAARGLFESFRINASCVNDDLLSSFIDSKLKDKYSYYLDPIFLYKENRLEKYNIRPLVEHPEYSPEWDKENIRISEEMLDEESVMETVEVELIEEVMPPKPPPPPPPNLGLMANAEIRDWLKRNYDSNLNAQDIEIIRRSNEVEIIFNRDEGKGTWICPVNNSSV